MAYIVPSTTTDSVTMYLDDLTTEWGQGIRTTLWYLGYPNGGTPTDTSFYLWKSGANIENHASSGGDVSFVGVLEPDTRYYVLCQVYHGSDLISEIDGEFITDSEYVEPDEPDIPSVYIEPWDWSKSNGTATDTDVQNTYMVYALPELYSTELFAHRVWNDMVEKVDEIRGVMGWDWDYTYAYKDDTKMLYGDYILYAYQFNSIRNNIEIVGNTLGIGKISDSQIPHPVYSGDDVLFSYFTTLTDYMNRCIDNL